MRTAERRRDRALKIACDYFGYEESELDHALDLRDGWFLFETDHTWILSDGERCQTIEDHLDSASRRHLCRWNSDIKQFEAI
jgi:hypothetical protein